MTMGNHKNCNGCKAKGPIGNHNHVCCLGYNLSWNKKMTGKIPREPCPKPTSDIDYEFAKLHYQKEKKR